LRRTASLIPDHIKSIRSDDDADEFGTYVVNRQDLMLWETMLAILEETGEIQLSELQHMLEQLGKPVTRRAIEKAIQAHKKELSTRPKGRDRLVSLARR
jgi:hypothetical protein